MALILPPIVVDWDARSPCCDLTVQKKTFSPTADLRVGHRSLTSIGDIENLLNRMGDKNQENGNKLSDKQIFQKFFKW